MAGFGVSLFRRLGLYGNAPSRRPLLADGTLRLAVPTVDPPTVQRQQNLRASRNVAQRPRSDRSRQSKSENAASIAEARIWPSLFLTALLTALILIAFATHIYNVGRESLWWDETLSYHRATGGLLYALSNRITLGPSITIDQHPPLYFILLSVVLSIAGKSEFAVRFLSVASVVLAVPLGYVTGLRLAGRTAGFGMAALCTSSPFLLWASQEARPYALLTLLGLLSIYLLLRSIDSKRGRWTAAWAASLIAVFFTHYMASLLIGSEIALVICLSYARKSGRPPLLAQILLGLAAIGASSAPFVLARMESLNAVKADLALTTIMRELTDSYTIGDSTAVLPSILVIIAIALVVASGLLTVLQPARRRALIVVVFTLVVPISALYVLASWGYLPFNTSRYVAFAVPGYFLLFSLGFARLADFRPVLGLIMLLVLLGIGLTGIVHAQGQTGTIKQDLRGASAYIIENARTDDAVVLASRRVTTAFQYYDVGSLDTYLLRMPQDGATPADIAGQAAVIAQGHRRMWIVTDLWDHESDAAVLATLDRSYSQVEKITFTRPGYVQFIYLYQASPHTIGKLPPDAVPIDARLGDSIRLLGYQLEPSSTRQGRLYVRFFWQTTAPVQRLSVFGDLVDRDGQTWASFDGEPFGGFYPTNTWKPGDIVVDERRLDAEPGTPPGVYDIRVGMRTWATEDTLPAVMPGTVTRKWATLGNVTLHRVDRPERLVLPQGATPFSAAAGPLTLEGVKAPFTDRHPGETIPLRLYWSLLTDGPDMTQTTVRLALLSPDGKTISSAEEPVARTPGDMSSFRSGVLAGDLALTVPRIADSGDYRVALALHRMDGTYLNFNARWWDSGPKWIVVSTVHVHGYAHQFDFPSGAYGVKTNVGSFAELAAMLPGAGWTGQQDTKGEVVLRPTSAQTASLPITLYWRGRAETSDDLTVFVQLLDGSGRLVAQDDSRPENNKRPTSSWLPFEVISDPHTLRGPEVLRPGHYSLIAGLYDPSTGRRLLTPTRDHVVLASVVIP